MHYLIAVLSKENQDVEEQLAPFQENNMGDCPKEYLEFFSQTEEYKEQYENESTEMVRLADGALVNTWANCLYREITIEEYEEYKKQNKSGLCYSFIDGKESYSIKDLESIGATIVDVTYKELYPTFEEFLEDWVGARFDEEKQDYGYWENPNAKWDYYSVGGRWSDVLVAKDGATGEKGEPALFYSYRDTADNKYSSLKVKDIDWEHEEMKDFKLAAILTPDGKYHDERAMESYKKWSKMLCDDTPEVELREMRKKYKEEWAAECKALMSNLDPEWTMTLVDIHI